jgi:hypothetical protein
MLINTKPNKSWKLAFSNIVNLKRKKARNLRAFLVKIVNNNTVTLKILFLFTVTFSFSNN